MLSIPHALTGAYIASKFPHPAVYIPLTIAAHYLQDWIPHWDVGTGLSKGKRKRSTAIILELFELAITGALIYYFWKDLAPADLMIHIWIGAFCGLLPDFMEAPRNFLKWEPFFLKPFNEFHGKFHHSIPNMWVGLAPQIVLVIAIYLLR